jgi:DNA-directed RNA polymerase subunit D
MIKIINKTDEKIVLKTDMSPSTANAIRRSANMIPIIAIDSLELTKNDSALYDEIIAHRAGLVPLKNEDLKLPEECGCEKEDGCGKCSIKLKLSAKGPCTVYSADMSPKNAVLYKMPLTILDKDQELEFVATAKMGKGIKHAKFSPGLIYYRYSEDLEKEDDEAFKKILEESKKNKGKEMTMTIESWGQIKAKDMIIESINVLNKEIKDLVKDIK